MEEKLNKTSNDYEIHIKNAIKELKIADHMMNVTYNYINDPKMLLIIVRKLELCMYEAILGLLLYKFLYKKIPPFNRDKKSVFELFKRYSSTRFRFTQNYAILLSEVCEILFEHEKGIIELRRKGKFFIYDDNYQSKVLEKDNIKIKVEKTKQFINEIKNMIKR